MEFVGGCQCGKVRYRAEGPRDRSSVCYCRMCQRAAGSPIMAFVRFRAEQVHWSGSLALFASSNLVERGFCRECGTPLTYRHVETPYISLTIASLDDPTAVQPDLRFSPETEIAWLRSLPDLPVEATQMPGLVSYQSGP